jgi:lambda family phage tail tape measure protein
MATTEKFIAEFVLKGADNLDKAKEKIQQVSDKINGLATAILGVGFGSFIAGALQAADKISDLSDATGIAIVNVKSFENAMGSAGGKTKNLERALTGFSQAIETANQGSDQAREAFDRVGVSLSDLKNLSEQGLLDKTIEGLAKMREEGKSASEVSATASQLLTKAFRGVDVAKFFEDYKSGNITLQETADAIKRAADAQDALEKKYRNLQLGAMQALEPILAMFGEHEVSVSNATKLVTALGIALGFAFGLKTLASIIAINEAILGTAVVSNLVGKNPLIKLLAGLAITAVGAGAAWGTYELALASADEAQKKAAASAKKLADEENAAKPKTKTDNANRNQELSAKQKAAMESNKRIAQDALDAEKEVKLRGASDLEKITIETENAIAKARTEIFAKTDISQAQKQKEFLAQKLQLEAKAETDRAKVVQEQDAIILNQKAGYQNTINGLIGKESTEVQKVNDMIAQQPAKYKEIGSQLKQNAEEQDKIVKAIKEQIAVVNLITFGQNERFKADQKAIDQAEVLRASSTIQGKVIEQNAAIRDKYTQKLLEYLLAEKEVVTLEQAQGLILKDNNQLSADQIELKKKYKDQIDATALSLMLEQETTKQNLETTAAYQSKFSTGWDEAFRKYKESAADGASQAKTYFEDFTRGVEDAFVNFAKTGKLSFQSLIDQMIADVIRFQVRAAMTGQIAGAGGFGGIFGAIGSFFGIGGGAKSAGVLDAGTGGGILPTGTMFAAGGGSMVKDRPRMVGEVGPELFIPSSNGTLVPNNQLDMGGGSTNVTYNINAVDASSFRSMVARDPQFIYNITEVGRKSTPSRRFA